MICTKKTTFNKAVYASLFFGGSRTDACHSIINSRIFTTEYTEFHGEKGDFRIKTQWYSVTSVVNSYFLDSPECAVEEEELRY